MEMMGANGIGVRRCDARKKKKRRKGVLICLLGSIRRSIDPCGVDNRREPPSPRQQRQECLEDP